jgi:signal transduction histidine kinase
MQNFILSRFARITISKANLIITLVIFLFTILFAYLLITENYHDYERELLIEQKEYELHIQRDEAQQHAINQKKLKTLLIKNTIAIATLAFILFAIVFGIYKIFHTLLRRDLQAFLDFFKEAAYSEQTLDANAIFFKEFKIMVKYANTMVKTISEQKKTLRELNFGLEDKVRLKTQKLLAINENLTQEKEQKDAILKAQKEFLRYTVHETNTPLSVILTSIELYNMQNPKDKHLSKIEVAVKNIFSIYDDLSYLVKKDQVEYPKVVLDLESFLRGRIEFFSEVAQMSKLEFVYEPHAMNVFIYFNETKLQRVLDNTLTNAIKYTPAYEKISVVLETNGTFVNLSVGSKSKEIKDTSKIFEAYYREESRVDGFGLGLQLVKSICEEEDVGIDVSSHDGINTFAYKFKVMGS